MSRCTPLLAKALLCSASALCKFQEHFEAMNQFRRGLREGPSMLLDLLTVQ